MLEKEKTPDWLMAIVNDNSKFSQPIPLHDLLKDSLYYPCSMFDTKPIKVFAGSIFSYVYVDILLDLKKHKKWVKKGLKQFNWITGDIDPGQENINYSLVLERKISWNEIIPKGWQPTIRPKENDGWLDMLRRFEQEAPPHYAYWSIWRRKDSILDFGQESNYFSLLYLGGSEMNAAYQALYNQHNVRPKMLAIINPGMGFWDVVGVVGDKENPYRTHRFFEKVIKANPAGLPSYLYHGYYGLSFQALYEEHKSESEYQSDLYKLIEEKN